MSDLDLEYTEAFRASLGLMTATQAIPFDGVGDHPYLRHMTYVQIISAGGFFAVCSRCGHEQFPNRRTLAEAEADARAHGDLHHVYPERVLEDHGQRTTG